MLFKTKEDLQKYLDEMAQDIEERLEYEPMEEKGMTDMREVAKLIQLEIDKKTKRVLDVAEVEDTSYVSKRTKLADLEKLRRDDRTWGLGRR